MFFVSTWLIDTPHTIGFSPRDAGVQRLRADRDGADADDVDVLVVGHLLAALLALLLGRRDEAGVQRERMTVDAARVLVDVVDRELGAVGRARADVVGAALLVDEADHDRRLARVRRAGLAADVVDVVGDAGADLLAAGRCVAVFAALWSAALLLELSSSPPQAATTAHMSAPATSSDARTRVMLLTKCMAWPSPLLAHQQRM